MDGTVCFVCESVNQGLGEGGHGGGEIHDHNLLDRRNYQTKCHYDIISVSKLIIILILETHNCQIKF